MENAAERRNLASEAARQVKRLRQCFNVFIFIGKCKRKDHRNLSKQLQRFTADVMLRHYLKCSKMESMIYKPVGDIQPRAVARC